jgi:hypothetical protein
MSMTRHVAVYWNLKGASIHSSWILRIQIWQRERVQVLTRPWAACWRKISPQYPQAGETSQSAREYRNEGDRDEFEDSSWSPTHSWKLTSQIQWRRKRRSRMLLCSRVDISPWNFKTRHPTSAKAFTSLVCHQIDMIGQSSETMHQEKIQWGSGASSDNLKTARTALRSQTASQ